MNKRYKLIKEYPNCGIKLGTIITLTEEACSWTDNIHKFPEFWQEIFEPNYEILTFLNEDNEQIYYNRSGLCCTKTQDGYAECGSRTFEYCLKYYKINSVKRVSDGEVFTIGDTVRGSFSGNYKIKHIYISERKSFKDEIWLRYSSGASHISRVNKVKQPLFITEDGFDIFEGDKYFYFRKHCWTFDEATANLSFYTVDKHSPNSLYFSTKEKVEEHIKMNKPEFTRSQIIKLLDLMHITDKKMKEFYTNQLITSK